MESREETNLARLPSKIEVTTAWYSNIASIWRAINSIKSSCIIACTTNTTMWISCFQIKCNATAFLNPKQKANNLKNKNKTIDSIGIIFKIMINFIYL